MDIFISSFCNNASLRCLSSVVMASIDRICFYLFCWKSLQICKKNVTDFLGNWQKMSGLDLNLSKFENNFLKGQLIGKIFLRSPCSVWVDNDGHGMCLTSLMATARLHFIINTAQHSQYVFQCFHKIKQQSLSPVNIYWVKSVFSQVYCSKFY